ncbi:MAG: glycosyltransferase [Pyrinomonadaceae bacterium]
MVLGLNWQAVLQGVAWVTLLSWLLIAGLTWRGLRRRPRLTIPPDGDSELSGEVAPPPLVSILVPARNEAGRVLREALRSMLAQDYGRFEIVAVNDRSTDPTGIILQELALADSRLIVIEGAEPPAGWLGKPFALRQAEEAARGSWLLATDADMIFDSRLLRAAMRCALAGGYDALTLIPRVDCPTFWERVFVPTFGFFMALGMPVERVNDPRRKESLGVGGFFLMRREALAAVGGYGALAREVAEDLSLAERLKKSGARLRVEYATEFLRTRMHPNLGGIWEGFTRNLFAGLKFSPARGVAGFVGLLLFHIAPPLLALLCAVMWATVNETRGFWFDFIRPLALVWLTQVFTFSIINRSAGVPVGYALTVPLGTALFAAILLNSMSKILSGRGVVWKGRKVYERGAGRPLPPASRGRNQHEFSTHD